MVAKLHLLTGESLIKLNINETTNAQSVKQ